MGKLKKVCWKIQSVLIKLVRYYGTDTYMRMYNKYLKKIGIKIPRGGVQYVDPSCYFDGVDYSLISIGKDCVFSRGVVVLTHDYSISRGFQAIGKYSGKEERILNGVEIGDNCFVGANCLVLPGTVLGNNCIVGAGCVVKGTYPDDCILMGNPAKVYANTKDWAEKKYEQIHGGE